MSVTHSRIASLRFGIAIIAFSTLVLELALVRVFDVILTPTMGYAVITATVFALGLGGIYLYLFPVDRERVLRLLPMLYVGFAVSAVLLLPALNWLPFDLQLRGHSLLYHMSAWFGMYAVLTVPFFIAGVVISILLTHYSKDVHSLYFADLLGAGIGCAIVVPLIPPYGPAGLQFIAAGAALAGAALLGRRGWRAGLLLAGAALLIFAPAVKDGYFEYRGHANKRGVDDWRAQGLRDYVKWDPVSKLEVFRSSPKAYNFAIDGGQQGSWLQQFDGDLETPRRQIDTAFFGINSAVHYFLHGRAPEVLVIGAAVGSETRAAVLFGARHVDAIELVGAMVDAAKTRYAEFSGDIFNHPTVDYRVGEGRTFLRASNKTYDIIQMFSNHTSSSIADGSGAMSAAYLQTVEAYIEYFTRLKPDGVMQINHHIYPRMLTTAAQAWQRIERRDFSRHVLVIERWIARTLPTTLIKMTPWTAAEVERVVTYLNRSPAPELGLPGSARPSPRVYHGHPFTAKIQARRRNMDALHIWVGTYGQNSLPYDVALHIYDEGGRLLHTGSIRGADFSDNRAVHYRFPALQNKRGELLQIVVESPNEDHDKGFSIWMTGGGEPIIETRSRPAAHVVAFDPLHPDDNLIPSRFLDQPFPHQLAAQASYDLTPVTDNNPYFAMIRKHGGYAVPATSKYMDHGTAYFLNLQQQRFLPSDWFTLFLVGTISLLFSVVFIFVPLFYSHHGRARWPRMGWYLVYFSCLGAGFIVIELVFVQLFKKLIGFPTHTYVTVIFSLLVSAGIGSLLAGRWRIDDNGRWRFVFLGILSTGLLFLVAYNSLFHIFLAQPLAARILVAVCLLFPIGLLMGMPLPLAVHHLGGVEPRGIPWAWGMNGFFTVFGGFLSIVLSYLIGFQATLVGAFSVYALAFYCYSKIRAPGPA